jgi:hypothetical protein
MSELAGGTSVQRQYLELVVDMNHVDQILHAKVLGELGTFHHKQSSVLDHIDKVSWAFIEIITVKQLDCNLPLVSEHRCLTFLFEMNASFSRSYRF